MRGLLHCLAAAVGISLVTTATSAAELLASFTPAAASLQATLPIPIGNVAGQFELTKGKESCATGDRPIPIGRLRLAVHELRSSQARPAPLDLSLEWGRGSSVSLGTINFYGHQPGVGRSVELWPIAGNHQVASGCSSFVVRVTPRSTKTAPEAFSATRIELWID